VTRQLLDHAQAEDRTLNGMMKNVKADQARVQIAVCCGVLMALSGSGSIFIH
jgi:hypothetical protein